MEKRTRGSSGAIITVVLARDIILGVIIKIPITECAMEANIGVERVFFMVAGQ